MPVSADEIKNLIDNGVNKACDFEVELKNRFDEYLPADADLERLNKIAMDIATLQKQDKVEWLIAMLDAYELDELKISDEPSVIEVIIAGILNKKYYFDEGMDETDYARQQYDCGYLDYLNIPFEIIDCINWKKIYKKFFAKNTIIINGGVVTIEE